MKTKLLCYTILIFLFNESVQAFHLNFKIHCFNKLNVIHTSQCFKLFAADTLSKKIVLDSLNSYKNNIQLNISKEKKLLIDETVLLKNKIIAERQKSNYSDEYIERQKKFRIKAKDLITSLLDQSVTYDYSITGKYIIEYDVRYLPKIKSNITFLNESDLNYYYPKVKMDIDEKLLLFNSYIQDNDFYELDNKIIFLHNPFDSIYDAHYNECTKLDPSLNLFKSTFDSCRALLQPYVISNSNYPMVFTFDFKYDSKLNEERWIYLGDRFTKKFNDPYQKMDTTFTNTFYKYYPKKSAKLGKYKVAYKTVTLKTENNIDTLFKKSILYVNREYKFHTRLGLSLVHAPNLGSVLNLSFIVHKVGAYIAFIPNTNTTTLFGFGAYISPINNFYLKAGTIHYSYNSGTYSKSVDYLQFGGSLFLSVFNIEGGMIISSNSNLYPYLALGLNIPINR